MHCSVGGPSKRRILETHTEIAMRLISASTYAFEEFDDEDLPKYAILSHTCTKGQEVSFRDIYVSSHETEKDGYQTKREGYKTKKGYHKILETCKRARHFPTEPKPQYVCG